MDITRFYYSFIIHVKRDCQKWNAPLMFPYKDTRGRVHYPCKKPEPRSFYAQGNGTNSRNLEIFLYASGRIVEDFSWFETSLSRWPYVNGEIPWVVPAGNLVEELSNRKLQRYYHYFLTWLWRRNKKVFSLMKIVLSLPCRHAARGANIYDIECNW